MPECRNLGQFDVADVGPDILVVVFGSVPSVRLHLLQANMASDWSAQLTVTHMCKIVMRN